MNSMKVLIYGQSGSGKSTSMQNLPAKSTGIVSVINKPFPFRNQGFETFSPDFPEGQRDPKEKSKESAEKKASRFGDVYDSIIEKIKQWDYPIVVIDDVQYLLSGEFMERASETGFQKFTDIATHFWNFLNAIDRLPNERTIYLLSHSEKDGDGFEKFKTVGKLLDDKITIEGLFTIVLKSVIRNGKYCFSTQSNSDTAKSPIGLFENPFINNDLAYVDARIRHYYELPSVNGETKRSDDVFQTQYQECLQNIENAADEKALLKAGKAINKYGLPENFIKQLREAYTKKSVEFGAKK